MATYVLDSWALMAFFMDEPAAKEVEQLFLGAGTGRHRLLLSIVNWGEIYYSVMRGASEEAAEQKAAEIAATPIEIVPIGPDFRFVRQAALFKAQGKISYADCFAAALAKLESAELVTGDKEFRQVEREVKIRWLPIK